MFLDLLLRHRFAPRNPALQRSAQRPPEEDFRDTEPSMFWLDSEPLPLEPLEATLPLVRQTATMARC